MHVWGRGKVHTGFWSGNLRERDRLEDPGIGGMIILKWIFKHWEGGMDRIEVAQNWDRWWDLVNTVINLGVP